MCTVDSTLMLAENTSLLSRVGHEDCSNFLEKTFAELSFAVTKQAYSLVSRGILKWQEVPKSEKSRMSAHVTVLVGRTKKVVAY